MLLEFATGKVSVIVEGRVIDSGVGASPRAVVVSMVVVVMMGAVW